MMRLFPPVSGRMPPTFSTSHAPTTRRDGKLEVHYKTVRKSVTLDQWRRHLAGNIRSFLAWPATTAERRKCGRCRPIRHRLYRHSHHDQGAQAAVLCSALKSGGAHVYAFHDKPIPVAKATAVAEGMARCLGLTKVEFFPKPQNPDPTVLPKPLNMPYLGGGGRLHSSRF